MGTLILVTLLIICPNTWIEGLEYVKPEFRVMVFLMPHSLELDSFQKEILNSVEHREKYFAFCGCIALVEKVNAMENWSIIGKEIPIQ